MFFDTLAELSPEMRSAVEAGVRVSDSGSSVHRSKSHLGMTNSRRLSNRKLMVAYVHFIPRVGIGDEKVVFIHPLEDRLVWFNLSTCFIFRISTVIISFH